MSKSPRSTSALHNSLRKMLSPKMLEEKLARRRLPVELTALMSGTVEGYICLAVACHQATEEWWQQCLPIFQQAGDDLFGIEAGCLLSQVDITVDLASD